MSRIAGILMEGEAAPRARILGALLTGLRGGPRWVSSTVALGRSALGFCGWQAANRAESPNMIAVLDGLIYNCHELGDEASDAELIVRLYREHGLEATLNRLNGDFALAIYDGDRDTLWLARDRFGVRPLYYVANDRLVAFASRPGPMLGLPGVTRRVNRRFVALFAGSHYRYFDNDPCASPFADVSQLPAANLIRFQDGRVTRWAYWKLHEAPDLEEPEEVLAQRYRELLFDAVRIRLNRADRPVFTLSGGMDSSSVLASAVEVTGRKQLAVSSVYQDKTYDESADIADALDRTVRRWRPVSVGTPDLFSIVPRMIEVHGEPVATATWLSHFLLCERVAQWGSGSLFGGLGGDELNAGEYEHFLFHFADLHAAGQPERLAREVEKWIEHHDHPVFRKSWAVMEDALRRLIDRQDPGRCLADRRRMLRYADALDPGFFDLGSFEPVMDHPFGSYLRNRTYQDLTRETIPCCLRAEDRQATAFGLTNLVPFLDHRLAEFMFRVPGGHKIRDGVTKRLLRRAMRGVLPEKTRTRIRKTGWNAPAHVWFSGCRDQLMDLIRSRRFRERGIYRAGQVERLLDDHCRIVATSRSQENHMMFFWQLLNLELWLAKLESEGLRSRIDDRLVEQDSPADRVQRGIHAW